MIDVICYTLAVNNYCVKWSKCASKIHQCAILYTIECRKQITEGKKIMNSDGQRRYAIKHSQ